MALIYCQECGKQISSMAEKCPNCAFPTRAYRIKKENNRRAAAARYRTGVLLVIFVFVFVASNFVGESSKVGGSPFAGITSGLLFYAVIFFFFGAFIINYNLAKSRGMNTVLILFLTMFFSWIVTLFLAFSPRLDAGLEDDDDVTSTLSYKAGKLWKKLNER